MTGRTNGSEQPGLPDFPRVPNVQAASSIVPTIAHHMMQKAVAAHATKPADPRPPLSFFPC